MFSSLEKKNIKKEVSSWTEDQRSEAMSWLNNASASARSKAYAFERNGFTHSYNSCITEAVRLADLRELISKVTLKKGSKNVGK